MKTPAATYRALGRTAALALNARHGIDYANAAREARDLRELEEPEDRGLARLEFEAGIRAITRPQFAMTDSIDIEEPCK